MDNVCYKITTQSVTEVEELSSDQEEALNSFLHANHALNEDPNQLIVIRSPSGDVDIKILFIATFQENQQNI